jgi:O-antigen ligase
MGESAPAVARLVSALLSVASAEIRFQAGLARLAIGNQAAQEPVTSRRTQPSEGPSPCDLSFLFALSLVLAFAAFSYGGTVRTEWNLCMTGIGVASALFWLTQRSRRAPPVSIWLVWLPVFVLAYTAIQLMPLPPDALGWFSPARARIAAALLEIGEPRSWNSLSVAPLLTFSHLLRLLACLLVFLSLRELTARLRDRPWLTIIPILGVASLESALGLWQCFAGATRATGTYVNPNHLAGLLEMALPFEFMLIAAAATRLKRSESESMRNPLSLVPPVACCALIFAALLYTLSRTGFAAAMAGLAVLAGLRFFSGGRNRGRTLAALAIPAAFVLIVFFSVPGQLLDRLASTGGLDVAPDVRIQIWKETLRLIEDYPVVGSGLGTYASAMQKYRISSMPLNLVDYAHSDYLQLLAEWGLIGFLPALGFAILVLSRAFRGATASHRSDHRALSAACFAALVALAIHSFTDFNLYIPVNAMVAAWVAGVAVGLG